MQQIISDEITWESILYDRAYRPFPYTIFKNFDEALIQEIQLHFLDDDFIQKVLNNGILMTHMLTLGTT